MESNSFLTYVDMIANDKDWHNDFVSGPSFFEINDEGVRGVYNLLQDKFYVGHNLRFDLSKVLCERPVEGSRVLLRVLESGVHVNMTTPGTKDHYRVADLMAPGRMTIDLEQKKIDACKELSEILGDISGVGASKSCTKFIKHYKNCVKELGALTFGGETAKIPLTQWKRLFTVLPSSALSFKSENRKGRVRVDTIGLHTRSMNYDDFQIILQQHFGVIDPDVLYVHRPTV